MRLERSFFASLCCSVLLGAVPRALAEDIPLADAVSLRPGASCLEHERLVDQIAVWLGSHALEARVSIEVAGDAQFSRFVAVRVFESGRAVSERRFEPGPARCEDLHAAVGLAVALACKASILESLVGHAAAESGNATVARARWMLGIDALGSLGLLPGAAVGSSAWLQVALGRDWDAKLGVAGLSGFDRDFAASTGSLATWLASGRFDLCGTFATPGRARLAACAGASVGVIVVSGRDLRADRTALTRHFALANTLDWLQPLGSGWSLHGALTVLVPVLRSEFVVRDATGAIAASERLAAVGGALSFGVAREL